MLNTDLKIYLPETVNDLATNGGRMSTNLVVSGVVQNVWPHVPRAERTSGSKKYRKLSRNIGWMMSPPATTGLPCSPGR